MKKSWLIFLVLLSALHSSVFAQQKEQNQLMQDATFNLRGGSFHPGSIMRRYDILFDFNKAVLRRESFPVLDSIAAFLLQHPEMTIETGNHTDYWNPSYSFKITQARACAVNDYLASKGVPKTMLICTGYNDHRPLISKEIIDAEKNAAKQDSLRRLNRRTEFRILSIDPKRVPLFDFSDTAFFPGQIRRTYCINFDFDKAGIRPESKKCIDSIGLFLLKHPNLAVEIGSHTDNRGNEEYNQKLSLMRARAVADYLVYMGISAGRLSAYGYGESQPLVNASVFDTLPLNIPPGEKERLYQQNRRSEIRIVSVNYPVAAQRTIFSVTGNEFPPGSILISRSVRYVPGEATLAPESFSFLDTMVVFLIRHPEIRLEIGDYAGEESAYASTGKKLSQQRAELVRNYLVSHEVPAAQLKATGYYDSNPLVSRLQLSPKDTGETPGQNAAFFRANGRTEFRILE